MTRISAAATHGAESAEKVGRPAGLDGITHFDGTLEKHQSQFQYEVPNAEKTPLVMNAILMVAYHFPPCNVSSGLQRTLSFSRHLSKYGWKPVVLSAHPRSYVSVSNEQLNDVPDSVPVKRAFALDTSVHLGFRKRYFNWMALPDRWVSWVLGAIPSGLRLIRKYKPKVLWSTYPIATAHLVGFFLHRLTGIPWVADFRDPMVEIDPVTQQQWPLDPAMRRARSFVERLTFKYCTRAVFASPGSLRIYAERYPEVPQKHLVLIQNGFEEESFKEAEAKAKAKPIPGNKNRIVLLHSGVLYPSPDRHPGAFFAALGALLRAGEISPSNLKIILRASSYEEGYQALINQEGIGEIVHLEPAIAYRDALAEMLAADGLLVFQGHDSNPAIPAKLYEYFRARRPIFAMVDPDGDTTRELRATGVGKIVPLDSSEQIAAGLSEFLAEVREGRAPVATDSEIRRHSREAKTVELARLLDEVVE
jgi:hypothetical protein